MQVRGTGSCRRQTGFTLIEVLITLLIVTVGILSAASMQVLSKRSNYDAAQRTAAANLSQDLFERMRANSSALVNYLPAGTLGGDTLGDMPPVNCATVDCTPAEMAQFDLWQWEQTLDGEFEIANGQAAGGLLTPTACIAGPVGGGTGTYTVAIAWRGTTETSNPVLHACGSDTGLYGGGNAMRRLLVMRTFIDGS